MQSDTGTYIFRYKEVLPWILKREQEGWKLNERFREDREDSWAGASLENAFERCQNGCRDCASSIKTQIIPMIKQQNNWGSVYNVRNDYSGPFVDPGLLSLGIPECAAIPEVTKTNTIGDDGLDIILNGSASCTVSTNVMRSRGILTCTIALLAERMEISTRIMVSYCGAGKDYIGDGKLIYHDFLVILKEYGQILDLPLVAFYTVSPASFRRLGFSLFDCVDKHSKINSHYYPANTKYKSNRKRQIVIDNGMFREQMLSPKSAVEEAIKILRENKVIGG